jgi:hypothetical protein
MRIKAPMKQAQGPVKMPSLAESQPAPKRRGL